MLRLIVWTAALFVSFSILIYGWIASSGAQGVIDRYQQTAPFSEKDMSFRAAGRTLFQDGVVLYHPTFPHLPVKTTVDRLNLNLTPSVRHIRLSGMVADIAQTLSDWPQAVLMQHLNTFTAPNDFVRRPLETLALLNKDVVIGAIDITLTEADYGTQLFIRLELKNTEPIELRTTLTHIPDTDLWGWTQGRFQTISFATADQNLLRAIAGYYHASQTPVPMNLKQAIDTGKPFQTILRLPTPIIFSDLFKP